MKAKHCKTKHKHPFVRKQRPYTHALCICAVNFSARYGVINGVFFDERKHYQRYAAKCCGDEKNARNPKIKGKDKAKCRAKDCASVFVGFISRTL